MGLFRKSEEPARPAEEHAVLIHIRLGDDKFGLEGEVEKCHSLQDELEAAIEESAVGMLDGDEFGQGECVIFTYGPDADDLWEAMAPVLEKRTFRKGSFVLKRYGGPDCRRQDRVNLHWDG